MAVNLSIFNSNKIGRFTIKLTLFLLVLYIVDFAGGSVIGYFFNKTKYGANWPKANWIINEPFDIVILGSSRAFRHYVPKIITERTGCSVFNAGENGQYLLYAYALEQLILEKYGPKIIVLDLLPSYIIKLEDSELEFDRLDALAPYLDNKAVKELIVRDSFYQNIKQISKLYRYNSRLLNIADNIRNGPGNFDNGYVSIGIPKFRETNKFLVDLMRNPQVDEYKLEVLNKFLLAAREKNIQVVFSFSPALEPLSVEVTDIIEKYKELASLYDIPIMLFTADVYPEYMDRDIFMDYIHMNAQGAEKFSRAFGAELPKLSCLNCFSGPMQ